MLASGAEPFNPAALPTQAEVGMSHNSIETSTDLTSNDWQQIAWINGTFYINGVRQP